MKVCGRVEIGCISLDPFGMVTMSVERESWTRLERDVENQDNLTGEYSHLTTIGLGVVAKTTTEGNSLHHFGGSRTKRSTGGTDDHKGKKGKQAIKRNFVHGSSA
jgi:hypothetical protein